MTRRLLILLGLVTAAACGPAAPEANAPADIAAVNAVRDSFIKAFNGGDASAIGDVYTADAIAMPNHQSTLTGRDAIVAYNKATFEQMAAKIELMVDETRTVGASGFDRGRFKVTMTPKAGGPAITDEGRYLVLLEKGADGAWKVTRDIDSSSVPLPPPPPPPPPAKGKGK